MKLVGDTALLGITKVMGTIVIAAQITINKLSASGQEDARYWTWDAQDRSNMRVENTV